MPQVQKNTLNRSNIVTNFKMVHIKKKKKTLKNTVIVIILGDSHWVFKRCWDPC